MCTSARVWAAPSATMTRRERCRTMGLVHSSSAHQDSGALSARPPRTQDNLATERERSRGLCVCNRHAGTQPLHDARSVANCSQMQRPCSTAIRTTPLHRCNTAPLHRGELGERMRCRPRSLRLLRATRRSPHANGLPPSPSKRLPTTSNDCERLANANFSTEFSLTTVLNGFQRIRTVLNGCT